MSVKSTSPLHIMECISWANYLHPSSRNMQPHHLNFGHPVGCSYEWQNFQKHILQDETQELFSTTERTRPLEQIPLSTSNTLSGALNEEGPKNAAQKSFRTLLPTEASTPITCSNSYTSSALTHSYASHGHAHGQQAYPQAKEPVVQGGTHLGCPGTQTIKTESSSTHSTSQRKRLGSPSSSLTGALGGQEDVLANAFNRTQSKYTSQSARPPNLSMELVPQRAYVVQNNHIYTKKPDILFDIPVHCGIASEAVAKFQGPPHWKNERMHCFASGTKISIRINWPGYLPSSHAINICDDTKEHNPITKAKLASNVVKVVRKVLEENSRRIQSQKGFEEWVISKDGSTGIQSSMVYLTKLRHVSEGSWQPELYVAWTLNNEA